MPHKQDINKQNNVELKKHHQTARVRNDISNIPDVNIVATLTTFGGSTLLTGVVGTPVVLVARNSSVLVEPLPDCAPVCDETDKGLEIPELGGGVFAG